MLSETKRSIYVASKKEISGNFDIDFYLFPSLSLPYVKAIGRK